MTRAADVINEAISGELKLTLMLAGLAGDLDDPVADAKDILEHTARLVLARLMEKFAVVELPEPNEVRDGTDDENGWRLWQSPIGEGPLLFDDGEIHYSGMALADVASVEAHAACLLAAARGSRLSSAGDSDV